MSVIDAGALEASTLADLHEIASELSIDGFRRLRRAELIDAIIERQGGEPAKPARRRTRAAKSDDAPAEKAEKPAKAAKAEKPARASRGPKAERPEKAEKAEKPDKAEAADKAETPEKPRSRSRGGRGRAATEEREPREPASDAEEPVAGEAEPTVEGVVELLPNGSGFVRVSPPEPSDDDVYVSAAQVKRCELVSGDRITGPRRSPRRSERFASLVRIDTINGAAASEVADGARFDELPAAFPSDRFKLGSEDPTVKAIEWLTPIGRGSRVTIAGGARSGKSEALRRLALALAATEGIQLSVVLAGVRPEEIGVWSEEEALKPVAAVSFAASADAQDHTVELVIDQARRLAGRGAHAVVLIDTLDGLHEHAARRAMASARNLVDGGSLTVVATASRPIGGETTVISLDARLTSTGRFPAIDLAGSGTIRPELLVGAAGADAIAGARAEALED